MSVTEYEFDVIVVGAGHAGTEAAAAAARLGAKTALLTTNLDTVGQMSCNPAIGGVAKGHIVREVDAMGGLMGEAIDRTGIQFRMLNRRKGPAMHSPRAQADKKGYQIEIKRMIESQENLFLRQEVVEDLLSDCREGRTEITGVQVRGNAIYRAKNIVLTTGTFLQAIMHTGQSQAKGGRAGEGTTAGISGALHRFGFQLERFKTGTPPRLNSRTIDYSQTECQPGDDQPQPFSFLNQRLDIKQLPCWITYTNEAVHQLIRENLDRAPMYSGQIDGTGPRYCPSIEDKIVRFAQRDSHQLFLEPEGFDTQEVYVNGVSTSLPRDVQDQLFRLIPGLQNAQIMRYGYAVEYDFCPPQQLTPHLESKQIAGLFLAGQINGTTGYEEAAGQGLIAGANAALRAADRQPIVLNREDAYIGVLIDDLVTCGTDEPYRMFTSRAEYRLLLRQDNADRRLTPIANKFGLIATDRWKRFENKLAEIKRGQQALEAGRIEATPATKVLCRPETSWHQIASAVPALQDLSNEAARQVEYDARYSGYIGRQQTEIARQQRLGEKKIPQDFSYVGIPSLRTEAHQKLDKVRPATIAQARRISGITPADIALLIAHLEKPRGKAEAKG